MTGQKPSSDARKARLAKALKANIGKRKAQARAQEKSRQGEPEALEEPPDKDGCPN